MALVIDVRERFDVLQRTIIDGNEVRVGFNVTFTFDQINRAKITGGAVGGESSHTRGRVSDGFVTDTVINFVVFWDDGKTGEYNGFIYGDHYLRGVARDITEPDAAQPQTAEWWTASNNFWVRDI